MVRRQLYGQVVEGYGLFHLKFDACTSKNNELVNDIKFEPRKCKCERLGLD